MTFRVLNYECPAGIDIQHKGKRPMRLPQVALTRAQLHAIPRRDRGHAPTLDRSHQVRVALWGGRWQCVFLKDAPITSPAISGHTEALSYHEIRSATGSHWIARQCDGEIAGHITVVEQRPRYCLDGDAERTRMAGSLPDARRKLVRAWARKFKL